MHFLPPVARTASLALAAAVLPALSSPAAAAPDVPQSPTTLRASEPFTMVAVTWTGVEPDQVRVSTRAAGGAWTSWTELEHLEDGPADAEREGSHLLWVGDSTDVRVEQTGGAEPVDLVLIDTTEDAPDDEAGEETEEPGPEAEPDTAKKPKKAKKPTSAPKPRVRLRKKWGANEKWRENSPVFNKKMKQIHVHHTASGNDYRRKDVPGIIRGFYRYHTKSLGWSDIGYNALVDKFGRAWVGRHGGMKRRVRGAHTLGFNHASTGIAVIGTYTDVKPSNKSIRTVARIAAWQLDRHDSRARGKVKVRSTGSTRFKKGRKVKLPIIDGHRHTNHTLCPGQKLFDRLPKIRRIAQRRINRF